MLEFAQDKESASQNRHQEILESFMLEFAQDKDFAELAL